jgi:dihydrofolate reductase
MVRKAQHKKTPVILIAALQKDRGVGLNNELLYSIQEDMKHFTALTKGHTVIMGRKTWESIPQKYRPLPGRNNIVVTRNTEFTAPGATVVHRFYEALQCATEDAKIFVIGGGEIYNQALSYADTLELTIIDGDKKADAFFPEYTKYFSEEGRSEVFTDEKSQYSYQFVTYIKK